MRRPITAMPRRPRARGAGVAKSAKEAAIHLVRLEFDASRLEMGIAQAQQRVELYGDELRQLNQSRKVLLNMIKGSAENG